jgi:hypothetical protein
MLKTLTLVILVALGAAHRLDGQQAQRSTDVPPIVLRGFEAYIARGTEAAFDTWLTGSPVASDANMRASAIDGLKAVEAQYGRVVGHEILGVAPVGTTVRRVYVVIRYERGPLYAWFDCYQTGETWIIPGFLVNTRPQLILPPEMLSPSPRSQN